MTADERAKDRWASIFRRRGADGAYTRLFDNLDTSQKAMLLEQLKLERSELPVIGSAQDPRTWLVLTTKRLAWSVAGDRREVAARAVLDATANFADLQHRGADKLLMRQLQVVTTDGSYLVEAEPGRPLSGVWSVLRNLGTQNRNAG